MALHLGYARFTRDDPDLRQQREELQGCKQIYEDLEPPESGKRWPGLDECIEALQPGDWMVVSRIERLACTLTELNEVLLSISYRGARLGICHWNPAPEIEPGELAEIVQRLVDFESAQRSELTQAGIAAARAHGRIGGRRHKLKSEQIKELQTAMATPGADPVAVGKRFGIGRATVYKYVRMKVG